VTVSTRRSVGTVAAIGIGVGSMLGAGVFSDMWVKVLEAGNFYLLALGIAGVIASANALSTAQLASRYHEAGGAYAYGREELGHFVGHVAGAAFVVGKTVSAAVAGLVIAAYIAPGHAPLVATGAIALAWALNSRGITRTAAGATISAMVVTCALAAISIGALSAHHQTTGGALATPPQHSAPLAVLVGASVAFFAFAGYARIATLSEEVRDPRRAIPRAIVVALVIVFAVYALIAVALVRTVGVRLLETGGTPIETLAGVAGVAVWIVRVIAVVAVFGALLAVMAGAGRTLMAMARNGDVPVGLAAQARGGAPARAEAGVAVRAVGVAWTRGVSLILVSVASVLIYYAVANVAAIAQHRAQRTAALRVPIAVSGVGLVGCVVLGAVALPSAADGWVAPLVVVGAVFAWPAVAALVRR